jgi:GYF domain 2
MPESADAMNYHVHFQGRDIGILSLDELRERRLDGRLTGEELVWREGMSQWQRLDNMLGHPVVRPRTSPWRVVITVIAVVVVVGYLGFFGYTFHNVVHNFPAARRQFLPPSSLPALARQTDETGVEAASRPIAQTTNTMSAADVRKRQKDFRIRQYVDAYKKLGSHNKTLDMGAEMFLTGWSDSNFEDNAKNRPQLAQMGNKLLEDPSCNDGIVLLAAAIACPEYYESTDRLRRAVEAFQTSNYKAYPRFVATVTLASHLPATSGRTKTLDSSALELLKESFADGSLLEKDQPEMYEDLHDWASGFLNRKGGEVRAIVAEAGRSFRWLSLMLQGNAETDSAWKARGGGFSDSVTQAGWQGFHDHSVKAGEEFTAAWELHPEWPQAAARMVYVIMTETDAETARQWFDRATTAQIDYLPAWHEIRWALRPRWVGSLAALKALGVSAINSGRFDTDVPRQFFDSVSDIESDTNALPGQHIYGCPDIWPQIKRMYEGYIAAPSQQPFVNGWRGSYTIVAFLAHHYDVARQQLEKLNWRLARRKFEGWGTDVSLAPLEVAARTGPQARDITRAEEVLGQGRIREALGLYQKLSTATNDDRTQQFVQHRLASLPLEQRLQKGEWIHFLPESTNDLNWILARGTYDVLPDGAVEIKSAAEGSMLYSRVRVGADFEIKGEFEVVHSTTKDFQAGVVAGLPELSSTDWYAILFKHNANEGEIAALAKGWTLAGSRRRPISLNEGRNSFDVRCQGIKFDVSVNGNNVIARADKPGAIRVNDNQFLLGLGAYNDMNETVIRYSNVQVRRMGTQALSLNRENASNTISHR